ncbi:hypothetical protein HKB01_00200, partial [Vibrio parahaemolyticus]|nr:hypothetical protein [Vibrio parahaemolyticus]
KNICEIILALDLVIILAKNAPNNSDKNNKNTMKNSIAMMLRIKFTFSNRAYDIPTTTSIARGIIPIDKPIIDLKIKMLDLLIGSVKRNSMSSDSYMLKTIL